MTADILSPITVTQELIRCPSITPIEAGVLSYTKKTLSALGFTCHEMRFDEAGFASVDNLYAVIGQNGPTLCFAGHTDVVPVGDEKAWSVPPFSATIMQDGRLIGRGAVDMKGAIGAFIAATSRYLATHGTPSHGRIAFLITNDEEAEAVNGTVKLLSWLKDKGEKLDACIVGEPTNPNHMGEMIKVGRRGTLTGYLTIFGKQGHVAYPHNADNPITKLLRVLTALKDLKLDEGNAFFQPSNLEITNLHVGNQADNVIPNQAKATFNIRFNNHYTGQSLAEKITALVASFGFQHDLQLSCNGESFLTEKGALSDLVEKAVKTITGQTPALSTTGGTSDARFIKNACPVVEYGLINTTAHQVDEHTTIADLETLEKTYFEIIKNYFAQK